MNPIDLANSVLTCEAPECADCSRMARTLAREVLRLSEQCDRFEASCQRAARVHPDWVHRCTKLETEIGGLTARAEKAERERDAERADGAQARERAGECADAMMVARRERDEAIANCHCASILRGVAAMVESHGLAEQQHPDRGAVFDALGKFIRDRIRERDHANDTADSTIEYAKQVTAERDEAIAHLRALVTAAGHSKAWTAAGDFLRNLDAKGT